MRVATAALLAVLLVCAATLAGCGDDAPTTRRSRSGSTSATGDPTQAPTATGTSTATPAPTSSPTSTSTTTPSGPTAAAPRLAVGDAWDISSQITFGTQQIDATGTRQVTAMTGAGASGLVTVNTTLAAFALGMALSSYEERVLRASDLADVGTVVVHKQAAGSQRTTTQYLQPCPTLQWPLAVGKSWTVKCEIVQTKADGTEVRTNLTTVGRVVEVGKTTVPAGTFDTFTVELNQTDDDGARVDHTLAFAPAACTFVLQVVVGGSGQGNGYTQTTEAETVKCAQPA